MHKLMLELVFSPKELPVIHTSLKVFDRRSHRLADLVVRQGSFGLISRSAFRLVGYLTTADGEREYFDFPFYKKSKVNGRLVPFIPQTLTDTL